MLTTHLPLKTPIFTSTVHICAYRKVISYALSMLILSRLNLQLGCLQIMWLSDRNSRIWYSVIRALRGIIGGNKDCESENCEKEV